MHIRTRTGGVVGGAIAAASALTLLAAPATLAKSTTFRIAEVDTVSTHGCVQTNAFERGADGIVWRIAVLKNGAEDKAATVTVQVKGQEQPIKASWDNGFFAAFWPLPFNAPLGVVSYTVTAKDGSMSASYSPPFLVPPSELSVVPYPYGVSVTVGKVGVSVPVTASVSYTTVANNKPSVHAVTSAKVVAAIALQGSVNAKGQLQTVKSVTLKYSAKAKAFTGSIATSGLKKGLYVVQVTASDHVSPPNTGTGTSLAFNVK